MEGIEEVVETVDDGLDMKMLEVEVGILAEDERSVEFDGVVLGSGGSLTVRRRG